jgi:hypothetical protein
MPALHTMTVEVEPGSDPISGRITDDRGTRQFSGWLELARALHEVLETPAGDAS